MNTKTYHPPAQPDGYPHGADSDTKRKFLLSLAPRMTAARLEKLRTLLREH